MTAEKSCGSRVSVKSRVLYSTFTEMIWGQDLEEQMDTKLQAGKTSRGRGHILVIKSQMENHEIIIVYSLRGI
jgi:hypothetical protein